MEARGSLKSTPVLLCRVQIEWLIMHMTHFSLLSVGRPLRDIALQWPHSVYRRSQWKPSDLCSMIIVICFVIQDTKDDLTETSMSQYQSNLISGSRLKISRKFVSEATHWSINNRPLCVAKCNQYPWHVLDGSHCSFLSILYRTIIVSTMGKTLWFCGTRSCAMQSQTRRSEKE